MTENKFTKQTCDCCGTEVKQFKQLKKLIKEGKKVYYCKVCYCLNRSKHREKTIEN